MNAVSSAIVRFENLRRLGFAALGAGYVAVGTPFANPLRLIKVTNTTDANLIISFDGVADKDVVAANSAYVYDYAANKSSQGGYLEQPVGDCVYVKLEAAAATLGNVYVTTIYAAQV